MTDFSTEATKKIQIVTTETDHQLLRQFAEEANVTQGFVLHSFLEMLQLVVGSAVESGVIDDTTRVSNLEAFIALVMRHMGLVGDAEFERAMLLADISRGENSNLRLQGYAALANERIDQLRPQWDAARIERKYQRAIAWDPKEALRRHKAAAAAGDAMVAADTQVEVHAEPVAGATK